MRPSEGELTRRQMLAISIAAFAGVRRLGAQPDRRWGVQLYTVRGLMAKEPQRTLERIAAIGYKELEVLQPTIDVVAPVARTLGLSMVSSHLPALTPVDVDLAPAIAKAREHGLTHLVVPYMAPGDRPRDRAGFMEIARRLSRMTDQARKAGLELAYHNHAFEFGTGPGGERWLDLIMRETAASGMKLELDVFWASVAGADPVAVIRQYPGRVTLLHLKDRGASAPTSLLESDQRAQSFAEVGSGTLDFSAIVAAGRAAGASHYFVEQDATPGDPVDSLKKSFDYLTGLR